MNYFIFNYNRHEGLIESLLKSACESHNSRKSRTKEWFIWKFLKNPFGQAIIACAEHEGRVIGCVAYGIQYFKFDEVEIKAVVSFENFVHPDFQKQGIFNSLLKLADSEIKKDKSIKFMPLRPLEIETGSQIYQNQWAYKQLNNYDKYSSKNSHHRRRGIYRLPPL